MHRFIIPDVIEEHPVRSLSRTDNAFDAAIEMKKSNIAAILIVDEDGKFVMPSIELPFEVSVPENDSFAYRNFILNIQRLKFEKFGQHAVDIAIDGRQEASIPLEVKQIPEQGDEDNNA